VDRRTFIMSALGAAISLANPESVNGQTDAVSPDLAALSRQGRLLLRNRTATALIDGARKGTRISQAAGEDMAFLPGITLANGTIACDLRGKNVAQQSFVGIALHAIDWTTHDVVYFRPFNFRAADPVSRGHAVQYHSAPLFGWQKLRTDHPGQYEAAVTPPPDPDDWFHARIVIAHPRLSVFVGNTTTPCLAVNMLSDRKSGLVGLWVGNNSGGDIANLTVVPAA
jgi:hypothetical protein